MLLSARDGLSRIQAGGGEAAPIAAATLDGLGALDQATDWILAQGGQNPLQAAAGAAPYLRLFGTVTGAWLLAESAANAARALGNGGAANGDFLRSKIATARFYADNLLPQSDGLARMVTGGGASTLALDEAAALTSLSGDRAAVPPQLRDRRCRIS